MDGYPDWHEELEKDVKNRTARLNELNGESDEQISWRKTGEDELARDNREWERIFNAISDPTMVLEDQYRIRRLNKATPYSLGMKEQEAVGRSCFELVHEEKDPRISASTAIFLPTVKNIQEILELHRGIRRKKRNSTIAWGDKWRRSFWKPYG